MRTLLCAAVLAASIPAMAGDADFDDHRIFGVVHPGLLHTDLADGGWNAAAVGWSGGFGGGVYRVVNDGLAITVGLTMDFSVHGIPDVEGGTLFRWHGGPEGRIGWHGGRVFAFGIVSLGFGQAKISADFGGYDFSLELGGIAFAFGGGAWVRVHEWLFVGGELRFGVETVWKEGDYLSDPPVVPLQLRVSAGVPF